MEDIILQKIQEKLKLEQEIESLQINSISKGAENININRINTELLNDKQKLETEIIGLNKTIELLVIKKLELETKNTELNNKLKYSDECEIKLNTLLVNVSTEQDTLKRLETEKGILCSQINDMKDEWGKLKRLNDKYEGIEKKLSTSEMNESTILDKINMIDLKKQELIAQQGEIEKQKNEFISNPLSIGYYIKFLQKRLDNGELTDVFDAIKRAS